MLNVFCISKRQFIIIAFVFITGTLCRLYYIMSAFETSIDNFTLLLFLELIIEILIA